jgi:hypothetical protein
MRIMMRTMMRTRKGGMGRHESDRELAMMANQERQPGVEG